MADRERRLQHSPLADDDEHLTPASLERLRSLERDYRSSRVSMCVILCGRVCFRRTRGKGDKYKRRIVCCLKCASMCVDGSCIYFHLLTIIIYLTSPIHVIAFE